MSPEPSLPLLGLGSALPPAVDVVAEAAELGVDVSGYGSWRVACHATEDQHPSTLGAEALWKALDDSGVAAAELEMVIFTGVSRDYPPSWSVATEIMGSVGASGDCVGLDLTLGCAASLSALDLIRGWLSARGGGLAAVVAAERWSQTVDPRNPASRMWAWADGAAAAVVGDGRGPGFALFAGAEFTTRADYNGHVLIPHGGTRSALPPAGTDGHTRVVSDRPRGEIRDTYLNGYRRSFDRLVGRFGVRPARLVCNQISPQIVKMIADGVGIGLDGTVLTGCTLGHLGGADVLVGLDALRSTEGIVEPLALGASTAYAFGMGLILPSDPG
ncbi:hypothetical protein [Microbacterium sp. NPDC055357]